MISTLLRDPYPTCIPAVAGIVLFCVSIALIFERLTHAVEFSKHSRVIRIAGIGSMVYASLTFTPIHDLMVTISLILFVIAVFALTRTLYVSHNLGLFVSGCVCFAALIASAAIYYTGHYVSLLTWAQRITFALFALWMVSLEVVAKVGRG